QPQSKGVVHWSISSVIKNQRLADTLLKSVYKKQALIPASAWLNDKIPDAPVVSITANDNFINIHWTQTKKENISNYVIYYKYGNNWEYEIVSANTFQYQLPKMKNKSGNDSLKEVIVTAVNRTGMESKKEIINPALLN
ncbi:MAG TPA: hypothetical protein PLR98_05170, partial [Chitinophagaceae bacterium]|nr:hypothetical protein [Chitinophagaceae bacterium]